MSSKKSRSTASTTISERIRSRISWSFASATLGVERRGGFYETAGALRDMIQSHVLQLTSLVSVEPPASFDATAVRNEKLKVLQSIRPFNLEMVAQAVVRG